MNPFFHTMAERQALITEARSWIGTSFGHYARQKGGAVDCVGLAAGIYQALGVISALTPPDYQLDGGRTLKRSLLEDWLATRPEFVPVWTLGDDACAPATGDLLCFKWHKVAHHVGVVTTGSLFVQAVEQHGVIESDLDDPTCRRRLHRIYRPVAQTEPKTGE